jgi:hypothetical protein
LIPDKMLILLLQNADAQMLECLICFSGIFFYWFHILDVDFSQLYNNNINNVPHFNTSSITSTMSPNFNTSCTSSNCIITTSIMCHTSTLPSSHQLCPLTSTLPASQTHYNNNINNVPHFNTSCITNTL